MANKRVGLGHLCLELHSSKATKRSVVDLGHQLYVASHIIYMNVELARVHSVGNILDVANA